MSSAAAPSSALLTLNPEQAAARTGPTGRDNARRRLDEAVFAAHGWPAVLSDDETRSVARLLALNLERAAGQGEVASAAKAEEEDDQRSGNDD